MECLGGVDLMEVDIWVHFEVWEGNRMRLGGCIC